MTMFFKSIQAQKKIKDIFETDISGGEHRIAHYNLMAAKSRDLFAKGMSVEKIEGILDVSEAFVRRHCKGLINGKPKN
jgi:hypothetical protein